jgi:hypothetical protein
MKLHVDKEADALHLRLNDSKIVESEEVSPEVVLDYNYDLHLADIHPPRRIHTLVNDCIGDIRRYQIFAMYVSFNVKTRPALPCIQECEQFRRVQNFHD